MSLFAFFSRAEAPKYTDINTEYAPGFRHWPRVLNYPPAALVATQTLTKFAKSSATAAHPSPESFGKFKEFLQAGHDTVEIVSREVLETAKTHLGALHWTLYYSIEVLQNAAHLTGLGGALIIIGALGVYLTQPEPVVEMETPKRSWTRILSYGAMITGLACIALATYRLQSNVNLLMKNFEVAN